MPARVNEHCRISIVVTYNICVLCFAHCCRYVAITLFAHSAGSSIIVKVTIFLRHGTTILIKRVYTFSWSHLSASSEGQSHVIISSRHYFLYTIQDILLYRFEFHFTVISRDIAIKQDSSGQKCTCTSIPTP